MLDGTVSTHNLVLNMEMGIDGGCRRDKAYNGNCWNATKTSKKPTVYYYQPQNKKKVILNAVGDLRESQWLLQQFFDTADWKKAKNNLGAVDDPLFPRNHKELRAYVELSEMCNSDKILDVEFNNKLKVKEYIRAWYVISELAIPHFKAKKQDLLKKDDGFDVSNFLIISTKELILLLTENGKLDHISATKSLELLNYYNMDHEVYSSPLFPTSEDRYLILTSIFESGNPVRSIFRLLSHNKIDISFKGAITEKKIESYFVKMGFICVSNFSFTDSSGPGEIDLVAFKENTFFICESKSIVPNESVSDRYRTWRFFEKKASKQAIRGVDFVNSNLSQICKILNIKTIKIDSVKIIPIIITNLFGFTGAVINGVYVYDLSALGKFATDKYVCETTRGKEITKKKVVKELYKGDVPTAAELLNQLILPFQVEHQEKRLKATSITQNMNDEYTLKSFAVSANGNTS